MLSIPRPPPFAARYTCPRSSGGAAVVTGRSVEVAVGVASDAVRAPTGWSWPAPFVHGTHGRTRSSSMASSVMADACRRSAEYSQLNGERVPSSIGKSEISGLEIVWNPCHGKCHSL